ncbi:MAG: hypothetical protein CMB64_05255 [Euryarchaeota archaeon]|nr:hypothetical protein [Euryarchaeota archaeon]
MSFCDRFPNDCAELELSPDDEFQFVFLLLVVVVCALILGDELGDLIIERMRQHRPRPPSPPPHLTAEAAVHFGGGMAVEWAVENYRPREGQGLLNFS